jgi:hypothetical protein
MCVLKSRYSQLGVLSEHLINVLLELGFSYLALEFHRGCVLPTCNRKVNRQHFELADVCSS